MNISNYSYLSVALNVGNFNCMHITVTIVTVANPGGGGEGYCHFHVNNVLASFFACGNPSGTTFWKHPWIITKLCADFEQ